MRNLLHSSFVNTTGNFKLYVVVKGTERFYIQLHVNCKNYWSYFSHELMLKSGISVLFFPNLSTK